MLHLIGHVVASLVPQRPLRFYLEHQRMRRLGRELLGLALDLARRGVLEQAAGAGLSFPCREKRLVPENAPLSGFLGAALSTGTGAAPPPPLPAPEAAARLSSGKRLA